jgi:hypothetical protein
METKNILLIAAVGLGAFALYNMYGGGEPKFFVPGFGYVPESQLPSMGYRNIGGQWYSQAQIDAAAAQAGVPPGTTIDPTMQTWNTIVSILNSLVPLVTTIITVVTTANKDQAITQILYKYTNTASPDYNSAFPYTQAQLENMTVAQLQTILDTGQISSIYGLCSQAGAELRAGSAWGGKTLAHCRWGTKPKKR